MKNLIEKLRGVWCINQADQDTVEGAAEALEKLTQPVGVVPIVAADHPDLVGGLVWSPVELRWINERLASLQQGRDALQEQVEMLREAAATLLARGPSGYGRLVPETDCARLEAALAATEPTK